MHDHHADPVTVTTALVMGGAVELVANAHAVLVWSEGTAAALLRAVLCAAASALVVTLLARRWPEWFGRGARSPSHAPAPPPASARPSIPPPR